MEDEDADRSTLGAGGEAWGPAGGGLRGGGEAATQQAMIQQENPPARSR